MRYRGLILAVALGFVGCGNGAGMEDAGGGGDISGAAADQSVQALADMTVLSVDAAGAPDASTSSDCAKVWAALCARSFRCSPQLMQTLFGDLPGCIARTQILCAMPFWTFDSRALDSGPACFQAIANTQCDTASPLTPPSECFADAGTIADGKSCDFSAECHSGYCQVAAGPTCGQCLPALKPGDPCFSGTCSPGLVCDAISLKCALPGTKLHDACSTFVSCIPPLACRSDGSQFGGTCEMPLGPGDACNPMLSGCGNNLLCDPQMKVCSAVTTAAAGQPCGFVAGKVVLCGGAGMCSAKGICQAAARDGAACDSMKGFLCAHPADCVGGVCSLVINVN